ncbi:hypothetical protein P8452_51249 [Trifolium repens]|nr:hypothetical protein P8452_51249 [Trifolium repens]
MLNLREKKRGRREEDDEREKRLGATPRIFMREMRAYQEEESPHFPFKVSTFLDSALRGGGGTTFSLQSILTSCQH